METDGGSRDWDDRVAGIFERVRPRILARIEVIEELGRASDPDDDQVDAARSEAHKLKGLLGTVGLPEGSEAAAGIERQLEAGDFDVGDSAALLRKMVTTHR